MSKKNSKPEQLRKAAEAKLENSTPPVEDASSAKNLLHELQVHQRELEMQNEALHQSQSELEKSRDHFIKFYELAPVGYITLSGEGLIAELNLTAATMLGKERSKLLQRRFAHSVIPEDQDRWHRFYMTLLKRNSKQSCDLCIQHGDGTTIFVQIESRWLENNNKEPQVSIVLTDITKRQQTELTLREKDQLLSESQRVAHAGIWQYTLMGNLTWSKETYLIYGVSPDTFTPNIETITSMIHADDKQAILNWRASCLAGTKPKALEYRIRRPDGTVRNLRSFGELINDHQNKPIKIIGLVRDITDCMRLNEQLEVQSDILSAITDSVTICSKEGIILYTNHAFETMFGYHKGELIGQSMAIVNAGSEAVSAQDVAQDILDTLNRSGTWEGDLLNQRKDGSTFWTNAKIINHHSIQYGKSWISIQRDITSRKELEKRLLDNEERLEMALFGSELAIWDLNISTGSVFAGEALYHMLGYKPEELNSDEASFLRLVHPKDLEVLKCNRAKHFDGDVEIFQGEYRLRHKDGHWVTVVACGKVTQRDSHGNPLRMVGTVLDVSQRKRLHEEGVDLLKRIEVLIRETSSTFKDKPIQNNAAASLTQRQRQILGMIASGMTSTEIGKYLNLSINTVVAHRRNLMSKLDLHSTAEVIRFALDNRISKL